MSEDINVNYISEQLNNKVDLANGVNQGNVDYVVESKFPTASDPTWYRVYKSGWVEQGGISATNIGTSGTITFMKQMASTDYLFQASVSNSAANNFFVLYYTSRTTTTIGWTKSNTALEGSWEVKGMSAQGATE